MKSKIRAKAIITMRKVIRNICRLAGAQICGLLYSLIRTSAYSQILSVLNYDGLDYVTGIFTFIGNDFHYLVNLSFFNYFFCVGFGGK